MRPKAKVTPSTIQHEAVRKIGPQQGAHQRRDQNERAAHGRRARLRQVRLGTVVAHDLPDLVARSGARSCAGRRAGRSPAPRPPREWRAASGRRRREIPTSPRTDAVSASTACCAYALGAGAGERRDDPLETVDARAFDEQAHVRHRRCRRARRRAPAHRQTTAPPAPKLCAVPAASAPMAKSRSIPRSRAKAPISRVACLRQSRRAPPCPRARASCRPASCASTSMAGAHRARIGVVGIIDEPARRAARA